MKPKNINKEFELYSSAYTMSDMELFIFPELLHAVVLSNIISPRIWEWKKNSWFKNFDYLPINKKIHRLKQFIMDNYAFNLDLETWGLTTKEIEIDRFKNYISQEVISESNALFGYEGDKYYFSIDIRKHFGLDKFTSNIIPYWKTETIEAMDAFRFKKHHKTGAGECVSLSALYAAAMYIILNIPMDDIFLIATPLHSQNFIIINDGIITNNRRILTKRMWFNGTILSDKARRALENEKVTYVSHISGILHSIYNEATIEQEKYDEFEKKLRNFLRIKINGEILINFLRVNSKYRKYFQFIYKTKGKNFYITSEKLFEYEHNSKNRIDDGSRSKLLEEIDMDDYDFTQYTDRYVFNELEKKFNIQTASCDDSESLEFWKQELINIPVVNELITDLKKFACISPKLPVKVDKIFIKSQKIVLPDSGNTSREQIINYLSSKRNESLYADLAFFAGRYVKEREWPYFLKSAIERNPVSLGYFKNDKIDFIYDKLILLENISIYDNGQFAQPDEVVNFERGDGIEKAITLSNILIERNKKEHIEILISGEKINLKCSIGVFNFISNKQASGKIIIDYGNYIFNK